MNPHHTHRAAIAALLLIAGTTPALAQDEIHWEDALSGDWSCFLCWDPNGPPTPIDAARIAVPGSYTVTLDSNVSIEGLTMDSPGATLFMSGRTLSVLATLEDHGAYIRAGVLDLRDASSIITPRLISLQSTDAALLLRNSSSVTADVLGVSNGAQVFAISGTSVIDANFISLSGAGLIDIADSKALRLLTTEIDGGGDGIVRLNTNANLLIGDVILQDATIEMAPSAEIRGIANTNTLSVGPTTPATVRGQGTIHDLGLDIGQHGVVEADTATLTIENTQTGGLVNRGTLRAGPNAHLHLGNSAVNNTGGIIEALDGAVVTLSDLPISVTGGQLRTQGSGVIRDTTASGRVHLADLAITGHYDLGSSGHTRLHGVIELPGRITANNGTTLECTGDTLIYGAGEILMAGNALLKGTNTADTLTNNDVHIHGRGTITTFGTLTNHAVIAADDGGTLTLSATAGNTIINRGTLRAENNANLTLKDTAIDNTDGTIEALDGSSVSLTNQPLSISRGTLRTEGSGVITDATNSGSLSLANLTIDGHYDLGSSGYTQLRNTINNLGTITLNNPGCVLEFNAGVVLEGAGDIILGHSSCDLKGDGTSATLTNNANTIRGTGLVSNFGTFTNRGSIIADAPTALVIDPPDSGALFDNQGTLIAESPAGLNIQRGGFVTSGQVYIAPSALLQRSTSIASDYHQTGGSTTIDGELRLQPGNESILDGGTLSGTGTLTAGLAANAGSVAPGASIGTLSVTRAASFGAASTLEIETGSVAADLLAVGGAATLDGTLTVTALPGDEPSVGTTFEIITAASVTGEFADLVATGFSFNRAAQPIYETDRVLVRVTRACPGDWTDDGTTNTLDVLAFLNAWTTGDPSADLNADGTVNTQDVLTFLNAWTTGC
ncbi:MAG: GC-type dockerin domain-anchored protein [Phycisphaerales bacterium JB054]